MIERRLQGPVNGAGLEGVYSSYTSEEGEHGEAYSTIDFIRRLIGRSSTCAYDCNFLPISSTMDVTLRQSGDISSKISQKSHFTLIVIELPNRGSGG